MIIYISEAEKLLCNTLICDSDAYTSENAQALIARKTDQSAFNFASVNQVASITAHALANAVGVENIPIHWRRVHEDINQRMCQYFIELDTIAECLAEAQIPLVALKNAGIARGIYPCPGCCPMGDLDVLVERRHFRKAHNILVAHGYNFEFRSPLEEAELDAAEQGGGAEYWKLLPSGEKMWFELQWRPVAGRWIRPDQEPSAEELMARSIPIPGTAVRLLAPDDNLLQVSLHTAKHSYVRAPGFRLHTDVDRIVRRQVIDWDLFVKRVKALQVKTAVYFSLALPKLLFDTPIPDEVLDQLRPPAWKEWLISRWLQKVGIFNPDEPKFGRVEFILFTAMLYDDFGGLWRGIFPDREWMQRHYGFKSRLLLPFYHGRRIADLMFRRVSS